MEKETCTFSYCQKPEVTEIDCDLLIMGGGMAGCGAAFEACAWANAKKMTVVMVDKAATDRSGGVAMGLSAINTYVGENKVADYVKYVRNDLMGIIREDLVFDLGRHVDDSVDFSGLPDFLLVIRCVMSAAVYLPLRHRRQAQPTPGGKTAQPSGVARCEPTPSDAADKPRSRD